MKIEYFIFMLLTINKTILLKNITRMYKICKIYNFEEKKIKFKFFIKKIDCSPK